MNVPLRVSRAARVFPDMKTPSPLTDRSLAAWIGTSRGMRRTHIGAATEMDDANCGEIVTASRAVAAAGARAAAAAPIVRPGRGRRS